MSASAFPDNVGPDGVVDDATILKAVALLNSGALPVFPDQFYIATRCDVLIFVVDHAAVVFAEVIVVSVLQAC